MFEERGTIDGDLIIARNTRLYGMVSGTVTVKAGRTLVLHGSVGGDLVLEEGAVAHVYGIVGGDVWNAGSKLCVWKTGTIRGTLQRRSVNKIEAGATIRALTGEHDAAPASNGESTELAGYRVVLVEDDHDTLEEVAALVRSHGAETFTARHGAEGYEVFARVRPDAIVTDLWMPNGGYDFIKRVRGRAPEDGGLTPAIAMTACTSDTAEKALLAGFHAHLQKPFTPAALTDLLRSFRDSNATPEQELSARWSVTEKDGGVLLLTLWDHVRAIDVQRCIEAITPRLIQAPAKLLVDARRVNGFDVSVGSVAERLLWKLRRRLDEVVVVSRASSLRLVAVAVCLALGVKCSTLDEMPADLARIA